MKILRFPFLALLVLSIYQFAVEAVEENSDNFMKHPKFVRSTSKVAGNKEKLSEDKVQLSMHDLTIKDKPSSVSGNEISQSQNIIQTDLSHEPQYQQYRKRNPSKHENEVTDDTMFERTSQTIQPIFRETALFPLKIGSTNGTFSYTPAESSSEESVRNKKLTTKDANDKETYSKSDKLSTGSETPNIQRNRPTKINYLSQSTTDDVKSRHFETDHEEISTANYPRIILPVTRSPKQNYDRKTAKNKTMSSSLSNITDGSMKPTTTTTIKKIVNILFDRKKENSMTKLKPTISYTTPVITSIAGLTDQVRDKQNKINNNGAAEEKVKSNETTNQRLTSKVSELETNTSSLWQQSSIQSDANLIEIDGNSNETFENISRDQIKGNNNNSNDETDQEDVQGIDDTEMQLDNLMREETNTSVPCLTCLKNGLNEEDVKRLRLTLFKKEIKEKLRINHNDDAMDGYQSDSPIMPKLPLSFVEDTLKDNADEMNRDQFYAKDEEVIIPGEDMEGDCVSDTSTGCFSFSLFNKIKYDVAEAQLWFYRTKSVNDKKGQVFSVFDLRRLKSGNLRVSSNITSDVVSLKEGWVTVNVTKAVMKWVSLKVEKKALAIQCANCRYKNYTTLYQVQEYKPLLLVKYTRSNQIFRNKRSTSCDPQSRCCKRDLNINFYEMNMFDIFEPRNLSIGYCYGECNDIFQSTFNHTAFTQRARWSSAYANEPSMTEQLRSCCVPLVLKDAFVMVIEEGNYIRKLIPKVIVETCGCV